MIEKKKPTIAERFKQTEGKRHKMKKKNKINLCVSHAET